MISDRGEKLMRFLMGENTDWRFISGNQEREIYSTCILNTPVRLAWPSKGNFRGRETRLTVEGRAGKPLIDESSERYFPLVLSARKYVETSLEGEMGRLDDYLEETVGSEEMEPWTEAE